MRVMELPNWPPEPRGGAFKREDRFVSSSDEAVIEDVTRVRGKAIAVTCNVRGLRHPYDYLATDARVASRLEAVLRDSVGKTLLSAGVVELPREKKDR